MSIFSNPGKVFHNFVKNPLAGILHGLSNPILGGLLGGPVGLIGSALLGGGAKSSGPAASPATAASSISAPQSPAASQRGFNLSSATAPSFLTGQGITDPLQQRTALATEAVSGGGAADQDRDYFLKLIQQGLQGNQNNFTPVEGSYLGRLGLPTNDNSDLLRILNG